jgi:hypothetical protein
MGSGFLLALFSEFEQQVGENLFTILLFRENKKKKFSP